MTIKQKASIKLISANYNFDKKELTVEYTSSSPITIRSGSEFIILKIDTIDENFIFDAIFNYEKGMAKYRIEKNFEYIEEIKKYFNID